jgi:hypothetical protein
MMMVFSSLASRPHCHLLYTKVATQSDIRDERYWTEPDIGTFDIELMTAKSCIISDIGLNFLSTADIRHQNL